MEHSWRFVFGKIMNNLHESKAYSMTNEEFRNYAHQLVDWMADYMDKVEEHPVLPDVKPGDILKSLEKEPPEKGESFDRSFDFKEQIGRYDTLGEPKFHGLFSCE